jgi:hypothetical protein
MTPTNLTASSNKTIEKFKTIGSTYMAASRITPVGEKED